MYEPCFQIHYVHFAENKLTWRVRSITVDGRLTYCLIHRKVVRIAKFAHILCRSVVALERRFHVWLISTERFTYNPLGTEGNIFISYNQQLCIDTIFFHVEIHTQAGKLSSRVFWGCWTPPKNCWCLAPYYMFGFIPCTARWGLPILFVKVLCSLSSMTFLRGLPELNVHAAWIHFHAMPDNLRSSILELVVSLMQSLLTFFPSVYPPSLLRSKLDEDMRTDGIFLPTYSRRWTSA